MDESAAVAWLILVIETIPMDKARVRDHMYYWWRGSWTYIVSLILVQGERQARLARLNVSSWRSHGKTRVRWAGVGNGRLRNGCSKTWSGGWSEFETCGTASTRLLEVF